LIGVVDACFLIDWCRFRRRELIKEVFERLYVDEEVLAQFRSEAVLELIARWMGEGFLTLRAWSTLDEEELGRLRAIVESNTRIPTLERPDLKSLVSARKMNAALLSENLGVLRVCQYVPSYTQVKVYTALDVLALIVKAKGEPKLRQLIAEYEEDTKHRFSSRRVEEALREVGEA